MKIYDRSGSKKRFLQRQTQTIGLELPETKTGRNQIVIFSVTLVHELLLRRVQKAIGLDGKVFSFRQDDFRENIHEIMQAAFLLDNTFFTITFHSFQYSKAIRDCILKQLSHFDHKDREQQNDSLDFVHMCARGMEVHFNYLEFQTWQLRF